MVRLNFIKDLLHLFTYLYCISARILLFISGIIIMSSRQFFWRIDVYPLKANAMEKKWEWGLTSLKDVLHFSIHYSVLARIFFPIEGNIRQIATCKQHFPSTVIFLVSRNAAMCIDHCTFWQQYWMSITPTAYCVGIWCFERHTLWLKAGSILLWKEERPHFYREERCMFGGLLIIFCRDTLSWKKQCLALKENCSLWVKGLFWNEDFCQGNTISGSECLIMCMGAWRVAFAAVSTWYGLLGCTGSNLSIMLPPPTICNLYCFFLAGGIFIWMNILAETSL